MLSDEEKKAIESLKNIAIYIGDNYTFSQQGIRNLRENLRIVLPVIEKQSKEIEELKRDEETFIHLGECIGEKKVEDKIKAKIEEIDKEIKVKREIAKNPMDRVAGRLLTDSIVELEKTKKVLQSLLEKEQ